ncbi:MAG: hypothetical protein ACD_75C02364G0004, partial [uncultured bacterium]
VRKNRTEYGFSVLLSSFSVLCSADKKGLSCFLMKKRLEEGYFVKKRRECCYVFVGWEAVSLVFQVQFGNVEYRFRHFLFYLHAQFPELLGMGDEIAAAPGQFE